MEFNAKSISFLHQDDPLEVPYLHQYHVKDYARMTHLSVLLIKELGIMRVSWRPEKEIDSAVTLVFDVSLIKGPLNIIEVPQAEEAWN